MNKNFSYLQSFFKSIPDAYLIIQPDSPHYTIVDANEAFIEQRRIDCEDITGKGIFDIYPLMPAGENVNEISILNASLESCIAEKRPTQIFITSYHYEKKGTATIDSTSWRIYNMPVLDSSNNVISIIHKSIPVLKEDQYYKGGKNLAADIKFQNALLKARTEATPDGVLVVNGKGDIISFNKQFAEIWKIPEEILKLKDDNLALQHAMTRLINPQEFIDRVAYLYAHPEKRSYDKFYFKDGRIVESHGLPITGDDGTYYGWAWYLRDITERVSQYAAIEKVRQKVARDLHDDIGSTLTTIGLLTTIAKTNLNNSIVQTHDMIVKIREETFDLMQKISENSTQMMESLTDIVWSINPLNDSMDKIISRMREYAVTLFEARGIEFVFESDNAVDSVLLNTEARLDFYLIFKESVNNLIKYSGCTMAEVIIKMNNNRLLLIVADNGIGFDMANHRAGNGLLNMKKRAMQINAVFNLESELNKGTKVVLQMPLNDSQENANA